MPADVISREPRRIGAATGLAADLARRLDETGRPIRVGLIGSGEMGTDIVTQCQQMTGITVAAIAEINLASARKALSIAGRADDAMQEAATASAFAATLEAGKTAITQDAQLVCTSPHIDVVIDATGKPAVGAEIGLTAMEHGKHLVMMNVEADVTIGAYLAREAEAARRGLYARRGRRALLLHGARSSSSPASAIPSSPPARARTTRSTSMPTPDEYMDEAKRRNMNPRMLVEFVDGSKTMVEMAAIANATGLVPDCPGMHGPAATLDELDKVLCPKADGGVLAQEGRRRLFHRQGRRARRLRHRRDGASAHPRAHA